ncbi:Metallo-dependent phosphatase [Cristinia sonorae]|uniref:Serine/threonine-protein phosphatase n=1 Tax=Cristinia sonorae TaxID=1940300 RepID=A0A8K0XNG0_9AGAR|nr:Metallo-dependent phosphatase [Cristinia sonorae]
MSLFIDPHDRDDPRPDVPPRSSTPERIRERQVQSIPPPYTRPPLNDQFYLSDATGGLKPNVQLLRSHFFHEGRLTEDQALFILESATKLMSREPNMLRINGPVTVCGDIHGQYYDLMKILDVGGDFASSNYLFLGDYVDRGCFGIECLLYLYSLKLWYPNTLSLLRGNHECKHLTEYFTFKRECLHKYSAEVYNACLRSFEALPLTALIDGKFFCVHGGISPQLETLRDLESVDRFQEPPSHGLLCDLLWADPIPNFGNEQEPSHEFPQGVDPHKLWIHNSTRGCSYYFTYEAACKFLARNELLGIFRGHEAQDAGYTMYRKTPTKKFPSVITVFSAPNYLDVYHNRGAIIKYKDRNITIRQYNASPHPYWLPNFMDAFTWSLPFVGAKITEMLLAILDICTQEELEDDDSSSTGMDETSTVADISLTPNEIAQRRQQIKNKVLAVGRMQRVFQLLRYDPRYSYLIKPHDTHEEESENATELELGTANTHNPPGAWPGLGAPDALNVHVNDIRRQIRSFDDARMSDIANERLPQYTPPSDTLVAVPSMRHTRHEDPASPSEPQSLEGMIRKALLEEGLEDGGVVERLAEKIARGKKASGRPRGLGRTETV